MTLDQFVKRYDYEGSIILLEGKRNVPATEQAHLKALGQLLAQNMKHAIFRSGNANGADLYFSQGVAAIDKMRLEVVIPFDGHRSKSNLAGHTLSLDQIDLSAYPDIVAMSALNKKTKDLLKRYLQGERNRFTDKVTFIIRDTIKVMGVQDNPAISFAIFYDDLDMPRTGGTGHTMEVCEQCQIPYTDQTVWVKWLSNS
jgi:hypothetical protein